MESEYGNQKVVSTIGNLVETLYEEVALLPLSDEAKNALVTIMLGDILKRSGRDIYFACPPDLMLKKEIAA